MASIHIQWNKKNGISHVKIFEIVESGYLRLFSLLPTPKTTHTYTFRFIKLLSNHFVIIFFLDKFQSFHKFDVVLFTFFQSNEQKHKFSPMSANKETNDERQMKKKIFFIYFFTLIQLDVESLYLWEMVLREAQQ